MSLPFSAAHEVEIRLLGGNWNPRARRRDNSDGCGGTRMGHGRSELHLLWAPPQSQAPPAVACPALCTHTHTHTHTHTPFLLPSQS